MKADEKKALLEYYADQYKYRNTHYWRLVVKDVIICCIIILFPYLTDKLEIQASSTFSETSFRIIGMLISILFTYLLLAESSRMKAQKERITALIQDIGKNNYNEVNVPRAYKLNISYWIPFVILLFHLLIAISY